MLQEEKCWSLQKRQHLSAVVVVWANEQFSWLLY